MMSFRQMLESYWPKYLHANAAIALSLFFLWLVLIGIVWAVTVENVSFERTETIVNATKQNANLAIALEEQTIRTIKEVEQAVSFVKHQYDEHGLKLNIRGMIESGTIDAGILTIISVIDEHGNLVLGSEDFKPVNVADREYFKFHQQQNNNQLLVGKPVLGRVTGKWAMHMTRRIDKPDGSFGGVVLAAVDPGYFIAFYQKADLGEQGLVTLVGLDGITRARRAGHVGSYGQDMSKSTLLAEQAKSGAGNFLSMGKIEGVPRFYSYRTLRQYPLIVAVGTSQAETLASFRQRERNYYMVAALVSAFGLLFVAGMTRALSRRKRAAAALQESQEQFHQLAGHIPEAFWITDIQRNELVYISPAHEQICGQRFTSLQTAWRGWKNAVHPEDRERLLPIYRNMNDGVLDQQHRIVRPDGVTRWVHVRGYPVRAANGVAYRMAGTIEDITESRSLQEQLLHQANHDSLTQLPNRVLLYDRLQQLLARARRNTRAVGVLFLDLDRFKVVNDHLGHGIGDQLLRQVAARLTECIRAGDTAGRLGGDEFVIILSDVAEAQDARWVAQKVVDALAQPFQIDGHEAFITASIGIATYPADGEDADTLIRNADAAMFGAKDSGRNTYRFYNAAMNEQALGNLRLENHLRRALERNEFLLYFQPKASLANGEITGCEALLRWQLPGTGLVSPVHFIPLLEDSGLIVPVGEWVIRAACGQIRAWQQAGVTPVPIAVNLSASQFRHQDICAVVDKALLDHAVDARFLTVEITESAAMHSPEDTIVTLGKLNVRGVHIAIDDFGTGYSSLSYLKRFPVDALKIDRSFVKGLPDDADDASIAQAVISMAHSLNLVVIAEGVETEAQRTFLAANGCDEMQGYYFSRPLPAPEFTQFLRQRRRLPVIDGRDRQGQAARHRGGIDVLKI